MKYISIVLVACLAALGAYANPVTEIDYQGKVMVDDAAYTGTGYFRLALSDSGSTTNLWETDELTNAVYNGVFSLVLGDASMPAIDPDIFSAGVELYLRVWFSTNGTSFDEMLPAQKLLSAPYAINADQVDGYDYSEIRAGLATGTPVYVEGDPVWMAQKSAYATGTPLYGYTETDPVWLAQKSAYATGTPVYVEGDPVWMAQKSAYATGTPLYGYTETDPVWLAQKSAYATGTPLYAYTEEDPFFAAVSNQIIYTNTIAGGDLGGVYPQPLVTGLQGRAVATNAPANGNILQWTNSAWTPVSAADAGTETDPVYTGEKGGIIFTNTTATGDLGGKFPNPIVDGLLGNPVAASSPELNNLLQWDGDAWTNAPAAAGGAEADPIYTNDVRTGSDFSRVSGFLQIARLQGKRVFAASPSLDDILKFDGDDWQLVQAPTGFTEYDPVYTNQRSQIIFTNTAAGGDLLGTYPNPVVAKLRGKSIATNAPLAGQVLGFDGTNWQSVSVSSVLASSNSYGMVNGMTAAGQGAAMAIKGAGSVTISDQPGSGLPGSTNTVQISVPVPLLQNVIWVATNGTASGPGNIDTPYSTVQAGYDAAAAKYAGQPATLLVASGIYTDGLVMNGGNVHVMGLNRPTLGQIQIQANADASLNGKQRLENLIIYPLVEVYGSDVKIRNCRINGQLTLYGANTEIQDCFVTNGVVISSSASNVLIQSSALKKNLGSFALDIGTAKNVQIIGCEIAAPMTGGGAVRGPNSAANTPPLYHLSHNVIRGRILAQAATTLFLNHNIIEGRLYSAAGFESQYFVNNVIIGTNLWTQAATATNDAQGNVLFTPQTFTLPEPWND